MEIVRAGLEVVKWGTGGRGSGAREELIPTCCKRMAVQVWAGAIMPAMYFVAERILPAYLEALDRALDDALARLPESSLRQTVLKLRRRGGRDGAWERFGSLHKLAMIGEAQGWLRTEEAIVIRRLAYRVAFLTMRAERTPREPVSDTRRPVG